MIVLQLGSKNVKKYGATKNVDIKVLNEWSSTLKDQISCIIKSKRKSPIIKKILNNKDTKNELAELQKNFVFVPTDKAQNNISIICKKFYLDSLFKEVAFTNDKKIETKNMSTYILQNTTEKDINKKHIKDLKPFKITIPDEQLRLPFLFWIPKMHKQPSKQRYIAASYSCTTKTPSSILTKVLKLIYESHKVYCKAIESYTGYNFMWIIQNSLEVHQALNTCDSKIKNLKTYDFSTLYTSIPLEKLKTRISELIIKSFNAQDWK